MKNWTLLGGFVTAFFLASASSAATITIDFEELSFGEPVESQYTNVTFISAPSPFRGVTVTPSTVNLGSSGTKFICTFGCLADLYLEFARPVSGLTFLAVGDNQAGDIGHVRIFGRTGLLGTVDILGDGVGRNSPYLLDLRSFYDITRIELTNNDPGGLGFDDFNFSVGIANSAVPEPATWATMILGFGAVGSSMRLRRRKSWTLRAVA